MSFPIGETGLPELDGLIECWRATAEMHVLSPGADDATLEAAEKALGRDLPKAVRALYKFSNGIDLFNGQLVFRPLFQEDPEEPSVVTYSAQLKHHGWPIPNDLVVFAMNGSGDVYGLWLPKGRKARPAVVQVAQLMEPESMVIEATNFEIFLKVQTAFYLIAADEPTPLLKVGLPRTLRFREGTDKLMADLRRWADPKLKEPKADPYQKAYEEKQMRAALG